MRYIALTILLFVGIQLNAQVIRANAFYRPFAVASSLLFDTYDATLGYSTRKLKTSYTGSALRVRESGGNTESDIGFLSSGELDTSALKTFCGSNDGFVVKWYNQGSGGSSWDAVQSTAAYQPRIVNAGVVERSNGKPAVRWVNGSGQRLQVTSGTIAQPVTAFSVNQLSATGLNASTLFDRFNAVSVPNDFLIYYNTGTSESPTNTYRIGATTLLNGSTPTANQTILYGLYNGASSEIATNNNSATTGAIGTIGLDGIRIGTLRNGLGESTLAQYDWSGWISELIIYGSNQSSNRSAINTNINTWFSVY